MMKTILIVYGNKRPADTGMFTTYMDLSTIRMTLAELTTHYSQLRGRQLHAVLLDGLSISTLRSNPAYEAILAASRTSDLRIVEVNNFDDAYESSL